MEKKVLSGFGRRSPQGSERRSAQGSERRSSQVSERRSAQSSERRSAQGSERRSSQASFEGYALCAGRNWREDIFVAEIVELLEMKLQQHISKTLYAKEVLVTKQGDQIKSPCAHGSVKLVGKGQ